MDLLEQNPIVGQEASEHMKENKHLVQCIILNKEAKILFAQLEEIHPVPRLMPGKDCAGVKLHSPIHKITAHIIRCHRQKQ
jgi:hypothetical protein